MSFRLEVVTPKGEAVSTDVASVVLPGVKGEFGVLSGHIPLIAALRSGVVVYEAPGGAKRLAIRGGYAQVTGDNSLVVLSDDASLGDGNAESELSSLRKRRDELVAEMGSWQGRLDAEYELLEGELGWVDAQLALA